MAKDLAVGDDAHRLQYTAILPAARPKVRIELLTVRPLMPTPPAGMETVK